jgi:hypothetical protein
VMTTSSPCEASSTSALNVALLPFSVLIM